MALTLNGRIARLREKWAVPGYLLLGWALIGEWSNVEFALQKLEALVDLPYGRLILILAGFCWLGWVVIRPVNESQERLARTRTLLREAAAEVSQEVTGHGLEQATNGAHQHMQLLFFLDYAFHHRVKKDYSEWLDEEHGKWKDAGADFPVGAETAKYLRQLANRVTVDDLDLGFYQPESYEQFRRAQNWQASRRPVGNA